MGSARSGMAQPSGNAGGGGGWGRPLGRCPRAARRTTAPRQSGNVTPSNTLSLEPKVYARIFHFLFMCHFNDTLYAFLNIREILTKYLENKCLHTRPSISSPDPTGFSHTHLPEGQTPHSGSYL